MFLWDKIHHSMFWLFCELAHESQMTSPAHDAKSAMSVSVVDFSQYTCQA